MAKKKNPINNFKKRGNKNNHDYKVAPKPESQPLNEDEVLGIEREVEEEMPITSEKVIHQSTGVFKAQEFRDKIKTDEAFLRLVESIIVDGDSDEEMSQLLNVPLGVWTQVKRNTELKRAISTAKKKIRTESIASARKLANGFKVTTYDLLTFVDFNEIFRRKADLIDALEKEDRQKVKNILVNCSEMDKDKVLKVTASEKYYPPQKDAIFRILEAYDENTWDRDLKRKKIPDKKIVVTVSGEHMERLMSKKKKSIEADFTVEG